MKINSYILCIFLISVFFSGPVVPKGLTKRITVESHQTGSQMEITDPVIVQNFSIYQGPSTIYENGIAAGTRPYNDRGAFIDWSGGRLSSIPDGLSHYTIRFYLADLRNGEEMKRNYTVRYAFTPAEKSGYIYLPMPFEKGYRNGMMYHGEEFEGHWYYSTDPWERLVRPEISKNGL